MCEGVSANGGRAKGGPFGDDFDSSVKMRFVGAKVTSDAGLLAGRELDEWLGLTDMAAGRLWDPRRGANNQHSILRLIRQSVYARIAGYEDSNDADCLQFEIKSKKLCEFTLPG